MDKLTRLQENREKTLNKIKDLRKRVILLDNEIAYLLKKNELLRQDNAQLLGPDSGGVSGASSTVVGRISGEAGASSISSPAPPIPKPPSGPICPSCGDVGQIYYTNRKMSSGKTVPLMICGSCKSEQIRAA